MPTKKEDKKELRHIEWAEQIAECQSSGMKIKKRLHSKFQECNHYQNSYNETGNLQKNGNQGTKRQPCKETENLNGCIVSFVE